MVLLILRTAWTWGACDDLPFSILTSSLTQSDPKAWATAQRFPHCSAQSSGKGERLDSSEWGPALRNWAELKELVKHPPSPNSWGSESGGGLVWTSQQECWVGGISGRLQALDTRGREFCKGLWLKEGEPGGQDSCFWALKSYALPRIMLCCPGNAGGGSHEALWEAVWMNCSAAMCWCFCVHYSSDALEGFFFPVKAETDKGCLSPGCYPFRKSGRLGARDVGGGWRGRRPCFLT